MKKKIWPIVFEFFMLFLAVFCGFLAENARASMEDHDTEVGYMTSMIEDLKKDTVEIDKKIRIITGALNKIDSLLLFLRDNPPQKDLSMEFGRLDGGALIRINVFFVDRTTQLLKNAGGMRLIRNADVGDGIINYWRRQEIMRENLNRYIIYRTHGREFADRLYDYTENYLKSKSLIKGETKSYKLISDDPKLWAEYQNIVTHCGIVLPAVVNNLNDLKKEARQLSKVIKKEYNLN